jgi:hypothetical protein
MRIQPNQNIKFGAIKVNPLQAEKIGGKTIINYAHTVLSELNLKTAPQNASNKKTRIATINFINKLTMSCKDAIPTKQERTDFKKLIAENKYKEALTHLIDLFDNAKPVSDKTIEIALKKKAKLVEAANKAQKAVNNFPADFAEEIEKQK